MQRSTTGWRMLASGVVVAHHEPSNKPQEPVSAATAITGSAAKTLGRPRGIEW